MVKKYKTILSVLMVLLVISAIVVVTGVLDINDIITQREINKQTMTDNSYHSVYAEDTVAALPLLPTDISGVYYSMGKTGEVHFYSIAEGVITELPENGSYTVKPVCSGQTLTAEIHYIVIDGKTVGYGLFTNELYPDTYLYDYAFFKVTDMFKHYADGKGTLLMLIDTNKERFYSPYKVYCEAFRLYNNDAHTCEYFLSENQRVIDKDAKMRLDYKMFTDEMLGQEQSNVLFLSSRFYTSYFETGLVDIFSSGGSGENVDNLRYIKNVLSLNFWRTENGVYYFEKLSENSGDEQAEGDFALKCYNGSEDRIVRTFTGEIAKEYILSGKYLLRISDGVIYDILSDTELQIEYNDVFIKNFRPDTFVMSKNGKYCIVRGSNSNNQPVLGVMNFETGEMTAFSDDIFGYMATANMLDDGTAVISVATGNSGTSYYQLVTNVSKNLPEGEAVTEADNE